MYLYVTLDRRRIIHNLRNFMCKIFPIHQVALNQHKRTGMTRGLSERQSETITIGICINTLEPGRGGGWNIIICYHGHRD